MALGSAGSRTLRFQAGCWGLLLPTLLLLGVFTFTPMVWAFSKSLTRYEVGAPSEWVGLSNYGEYFHDTTFFVSFRNMAFLTAFAVLVRLVVPLGVAKLIISLKGERFRHFYRILFLAPIVIPLVAVQLIWRGLIYGQDGLLDRTLELIGLDVLQQGWLTDPRTALWAIAFIGFPFVGGFEVLVYYAGLAAIPESVNDSARIDGATGLNKFLRIDVPMVLSQIRLIVTLTVIAGVQGFELILILTKGQPGFETMVPGLWMYYNAFSFQRMGYACAIGVILFAVIATLTALNLRFLRRTEEVQV
jgi:raffinose/stachyose/melibiose transport system permease protein